MQAIPSVEEPRSGATLTQQVEQNHNVRNIASGDTARGAGPGSAYLFDGARLVPWGCSRLPGLECEPDGAATGTRVLALATRTSDDIPTAVSWALRTRDCMGAPAAPAAPAAAASLSGSTPAGVAADDLWSPEDWDSTTGRGDPTEGSAVPPTGGVLTTATTAVGSSNPAAADYCSRHQGRTQPPPAASITPAAAGQAGGTLSRLTLLAPHAGGAHHKQQHLQELIQLQRGPAVLVHVPLKRLRLHPLSAAAADPSSLEQQQEEDEHHTAGQAGLLPPLPLLRLYPMGHGPIVYNAEAKTTAPAAARGGCMAATAGARCSSSTLAGGCGGSGNSGSPAAVQPAVVSRDANCRRAACSSGPDAAVEGGGAVLVPAGSSAAASSSSTQKRVRLEEGEQEAEQKLCTGGDGGSPNQVQQQVVTTTLLGANGNSCWCCHHHRPCCCVWTEDMTEDSSCWGSSSSRSSSGGGGVGA